jgi:hypothetical protein
VDAVAGRDATGVEAYSEYEIPCPPVTRVTPPVLTPPVLVPFSVSLPSCSLSLFRVLVPFSLSLSLSLSLLTLLCHMSLVCYHLRAYGEVWTMSD